MAPDPEPTADPPPPTDSEGEEEQGAQGGGGGAVATASTATASASSSTAPPPPAVDARLAWLAGRAAGLLGCAPEPPPPALTAEDSPAKAALASFLDEGSAGGGGAAAPRPLVVWATPDRPTPSLGAGRDLRAAPPSATRVALFTRAPGPAPADVASARAVVSAAALPAAALGSPDAAAALARGVLAPAAAGVAARARAGAAAVDGAPPDAAAARPAALQTSSAAVRAAAAAAAADAAADLAAAASAAAAAARGRTLLPLPPPAVVARVAAAARGADIRDDVAVARLEAGVDGWARLAARALGAADGDGDAAGDGRGPTTPSGGGSLLRAEAARATAAAADAAGLADQLDGAPVADVEAALDAAGSSYGGAVRRLRGEARGAARRAGAAARLATALLGPAALLASVSDLDGVEGAAGPLWACVAVAAARVGGCSSGGEEGTTTARLPLSASTFERLLRLAIADALARVRDLVPGAGGGDGGGGAANNAADPGDVVGRAKAMLRALGGLKAGFFRARAAAAARSRASGDATDGSPSPPPAWPFDPAAIFAQVDAAAARAAAVADAFAALAAYGRAGRAELGGPAGAALTAAARAAAADGAAAGAGLVSAAFDLLDERAGGPTFTAAAAALSAAAPGVDARLAAVVGAALDVGAGLGPALHAGEAAADGLLDRRPAATVLAGRAGPLLAALAAEAGAVRDELAARRGCPPVARGCTPVAGALAWARGLRERLSALAARTAGLLGSDALARGDDGRAAGGAVSAALAMIDAYETELVNGWRQRAADTCAAGLGAPVLVRPAGGAAASAAIPADVDALLAEARALMALPGPPVSMPDGVRALVAAGPAMRAAAAALDAAAGRAAALAASITRTEAPLLAPRLAAMQSAVEAGTSGRVTWASAVPELLGGDGRAGPDSPAAVAASLAAAVRAAGDAAASIRGGSAAIAALSSTWSAAPLIDDGPGGRTAAAGPLPFADWCAAVEAGLAARRAAVATAARDAAAALAAARATYGAEADGGAAAWDAFEAGVCGELVAAADAVAAGAAAWLARALSSRPAGPALTVSLDLVRGGSGPAFVPPLTGGASPHPRTQPSLAATVDAWIAALAADVAGAAPAFAGRSGAVVGAAAGPDVERSSPPPPALAAAAATLRSAVVAAAAAATAWAEPFTRVAARPAVRDAAAALAAWADQHSTRADDGASPGTPPLAAYEAAFADARAVADAIAALPPTTSAWHPATAGGAGGATATPTAAAAPPPPPLHIDARPARQALAAAANRWTHALGEHLASSVAAALDEEARYAAATAAVLDDGDADGVVALADAEEDGGGARDDGPPPPPPTDGDAAPDSPPPGDTAAADGAAAAAAAAARAARDAARAKAAAALYAATRAARDVAARAADGPRSADARHAALADAAALLARVGAPLPDATERALAAAPAAWRALAKRAAARTDALAPARAAEADRLRAEGQALAADIAAFTARFAAAGLADGPPGGGPLTAAHAAWAASALADLVGDGDGAPAGEGAPPTLAALEAAAARLAARQALMDVFPIDAGPLRSARAAADGLAALWSAAVDALATLDAWAATPWSALDAGALGERARALARSLPPSLPRAAKAAPAYRALVDGRLAALVATLPLAEELANPAMRARHWDALAAAVGAPPGSLRPPGVVDGGGGGGGGGGVGGPLPHPHPHPHPHPPLTLATLIALDLPAHADAVAACVDAARREAGVEKALARIDAAWAGPPGALLTFAPHAATGVPVVSVPPSITDALDADGLVLQNLASGRLAQANPAFAARVSAWQARLGAADALLAAWTVAQRKWTALHAIFTGSADVRAALPDACAAFDDGDARFRAFMAAAAAGSHRLIDAAAVPGAVPALEGVTAALEAAEAALAGYVEAKRRAFPRFYFLAPADLLDLLARGGDARAVAAHLPKAFESVAGLRWAPPGPDGGPSTSAVALVSGDGETVRLASPTPCVGPAEVWLGGLEAAMRAALSSEFKAALASYDDDPAARPAWALAHTAQVAVVASRTHFAASVGAAFRALEDGDDGALRAEADRQAARLAGLIAAVDDPALTPSARRKLVTLATIDVHARDVLAGLAADPGAASPDCFRWASQLRYYAHPTSREATASICDADIPYGYEFVGNPGCLCITPLTDRCYITLTQAQRLVLGGAPAGPAGTGKTETTKDLARALGVACYVFNCSSAMDFRAMGSIFKGLAQTGAWGCFDEFNRIAVDVLSVCSTQYKAVLDGLRARAPTFEPGDGGPPAPLKPSAMAFITMNPGYPGRAELPESLKALFRPVSMTVPDLALICEVMLMAEGFQASRPLARKFVGLHAAAAGLLSPARHYDWALRAIKTTLAVAGAARRAPGAAALGEARILLRALRDFNVGKLAADDGPVFAGLLDDLFPGLPATVPRGADAAFEAAAAAAAVALGYQPDAGFLLKVSQLRDILGVRWSVFLLGPPGAGKTAVWRTLARALTDLGEATDFVVINPKSVTRDELYGSLHPTTREWRDGLLSRAFRAMAAKDAASASGAGGDGAGGGGAAPPAAPAHQWIVLDGDLDPEWVESMNTVMDDNRTLTLASGERVPLAPSMRLLLETDSMAHCSPATVSRGGVIYVNADDVGWRPFLDSWVAGLPPALRGGLGALVAKCVERTLGAAAAPGCAWGPSAWVTPVPPIAQVATLTRLVGACLAKWMDGGGGGGGPPAGGGAALPPPPPRAHVEAAFVWSAVWAFGGGLATDPPPGSPPGTPSPAAAFAAWWAAEWRGAGVAAPPDGTSLFECVVDAAAGALVPVPPPPPALPAGVPAPAPAPLPSSSSDPYAALTPPLSASTAGAAALSPGTPPTLPTPAAAARAAVARALLDAGHPVALVGPAGSGKTAALRAVLRDLQADGDGALISGYLPCHAGTGAAAVQAALEARLEKRAGHRYGPAGGARASLFLIDDANAPSPDKYGTQAGCELLRQALDAGGWYDTGGRPGAAGAGAFKAVAGARLAAALNPAAGSFALPPRLARHFSTLAVGPPGPGDLMAMFGPGLAAHLSAALPGAAASSLAAKLVAASGAVVAASAAAFVPTGAAPHYCFSSRDVGVVVSGLLTAHPSTFANPATALRLWAHELDRAVRDRLASQAEWGAYERAVVGAARAHFSGGDGAVSDPAAVLAAPRLFTRLRPPAVVDGSADPSGEGDGPAPLAESTLEAVRAGLIARGGPAAAGLVLFDEAVLHAARLVAVLDKPGGHALLVGVGGWGKQSLARLAARVVGADVACPPVGGGGGSGGGGGAAPASAAPADASAAASADFKAALAPLYTKAGARSRPVVLLVTDAHLREPAILAALHDQLARGWVAGVGSADEQDAWRAAARPDVKEAGLLDTPDACWDAFTARLRRNLHVVACVSPAGAGLRARLRAAPALASVPSVHWFHPWSAAALASVASRFMADTLGEALSPAHQAAAAGFFVAAHAAAGAACTTTAASTGRRTYVTPKSFLAALGQYASLLSASRTRLASQRSRLEAGVSKIAAARAQVDSLRAALAVEQDVVAKRAAETAALIESIGVEKAAADAAAEAGRADEEAAAALAAEVAAVQAECARDLAAAEPAVAAATAALNSLDKASLGELKSFGSPSADVAAVVAACMVLTAPGGRLPKDTSWPAAKKFMGNVDAFLKALLAFDKEAIPVACVEAVERDYLSLPGFTPDAVRVKSAAAAGLCAWVTNIVRYFRLHQVVGPKRAALAAASARLAAANAKLSGIRADVARIRERVAGLESSLARAAEDKAAAAAAAARTAGRAALAQRLTAGLASEFERWSVAIAGLKAREATLAGDAALAAAFLAYAPPFPPAVRADLVARSWVPALRAGVPAGDGGPAALPLAPSAAPLDLLVTPAASSAWAAQGLGADAQSLENGVAVVAATGGVEELVGGGGGGPASRAPSPGGRRWPLLVDPQLQGARWVAGREAGAGLVTLQQGDARFASALADAAASGSPVLVEAMGEEVSPALEALLAAGPGAAVGAHGRPPATVRVGEADVLVHPAFRLYLQTRLPCPHYPPEVAAQVSLVDCSITRAGLEDQLLARVVDAERPDLARAAAELAGAAAAYAATLTGLEDDLLARLAAACGDILEDSALVDGLEATKATAAEVAAKAAASADAAAGIEAARAAYRPAAARGALLYLLVSALPSLDRVYHFSMAAFVRALEAGMAGAAAAAAAAAGEEGGGGEGGGGGGGGGPPPGGPPPPPPRAPPPAAVARRVDLLVEAITRSVFAHVSQGLFERHKLAFACQLTLAVLADKGALPPPRAGFLLTGRVEGAGPGRPAGPNPAPSWMPDAAWAAVTAASAGLAGFEGLADDIAASPKRWQAWVEADRPEAEPLPGDWKRLPALDRLLVFRALRPDRLAAAVRRFVGGVLGPEFVEAPHTGGGGTGSGGGGGSAHGGTAAIVDRALADGGGPTTPVLLWLSPGVDAAAAVEKAARARGLSAAGGSYASVSLGQGQEGAAMAALAAGRAKGGWVLLQNIHLTAGWTAGPLAAAIDKLGAGGGGGGGGGAPGPTDPAAPTTPVHPDFRLFLSAEPPPALERPLPPSLLQACVKVTSEPPEGLHANVLRAFGAFDDGFFEGCGSPGALHAICLALAYFHGALVQRKRYGVGNLPGSRSGMGWAMDYPFSGGDLRCAAATVATYLDAAATGGGGGGGGGGASAVPWDDLRYLVGDILYGGHVVEAGDRRLVAAYLARLFQPGLLESGGGAPPPGGPGPAVDAPASAPPPLLAGLPRPPPGANHAASLAHLRDHFPPDGPGALGMFPNAEVGCRLREAAAFCDQLRCLGAAFAAAGGGGGGGRGPAPDAGDAPPPAAPPAPSTDFDARVKAALADVADRLPPPADTAGARARAGGDGLLPLLAAALQEGAALNALLAEVRRSTDELRQGLAGELAMSEAMDGLARALGGGAVPPAWTALAGPTARGLDAWLAHLSARAAQLADWLADGLPPASVWLPGLFQPRAFLMAVVQTVARASGWPLDEAALVVEPAKTGGAPAASGSSGPSAVAAAAPDRPAPKDGVLVHGLVMEGGRWDEAAGCLAPPKSGTELLAPAPPFVVRAVPAGRGPPPGTYACPVYATETRFRQEVCVAYLRTRTHPDTWTLAGTALFLEAGV